MKHTTGASKATSTFLRQQYKDKVKAQGSLKHPHRPVIELAQAIADVDNDGNVRSVTFQRGSSFFGMS